MAGSRPQSLLLVSPISGTHKCTTIYVNRMGQMSNFKSFPFPLKWGLLKQDGAELGKEAPEEASAPQPAACPLPRLLIIH